MRKVEFLLAREDRTWDTAVHEVPEDRCYTLMDMVNWANENLMTLAQYRDVVLVAVYNENFEPDVEDEPEDSTEAHMARWDEAKAGGDEQG